jgi:hypothetical protein
VERGQGHPTTIAFLVLPGEINTKQLSCRLDCPTRGNGFYGRLELNPESLIASVPITALQMNLKDVMLRKD